MPTGSFWGTNGPVLVHKRGDFGANGFERVSISSSGFRLRRVGFLEFLPPGDSGFSRFSRPATRVSRLFLALTLPSPLETRHNRPRDRGDLPFRSPSASRVAPPDTPRAMAWGFLGSVLGRVAQRPAKRTSKGARDATPSSTPPLSALLPRFSRAFSGHRDAAGDAAEGDVANAIEAVRDAPTIVRVAETSRRRNNLPYPPRRRLPAGRNDDRSSRVFLLPRAVPMESDARRRRDRSA